MERKLGEEVMGQENKETKSETTKRVVNLLNYWGTLEFFNKATGRAIKGERKGRQKGRQENKRIKDYISKRIPFFS